MSFAHRRSIRSSFRDAAARAAGDRLPTTPAIARLISLPCLAVVAGAAACGFVGDGDAGVVVRDSAGIRIVENGAPAWDPGEGWHVVPRSVVDIGVTEGDAAAQLHDVSGAVRLDDGRIVVADGGSREIRVFDSRGDYLVAFGGGGGGPGEFEELASLRRLAGDTLVAFDPSAGRATVFTEGGDVVRVVSFAGEGVVWTARLADGAFVGRVGRALPARDRMGLIRPPAALVRFDRDGEPRDTLGVFPGREVGRWRGGVGMPAFSRGFVHASDGRRVHAGIQTTFEVRTFGLDGALTRILRGPARDLTYDDAELRAHLDRFIDRTGNDMGPAARERFLDEYVNSAPRPETRPAYGELRVDAAGNLWVSAYAPPMADPTRWTVFDTDGRMLGTVDVPDRVRVFEIGRDYVLGRWRDEMDVEHVRMYRLLKSAG